MDDFAFVADDVQVLTALLRNAAARKEPASTCCCTARPAPARPSWPRWCAQAAGLELYEVEYADRDGNSLSGPRPLPQPADQPGLPEGQRAGVALLFDEVEDVFPPISSEAAQLMARPDSGDGPAGQRQRQGLGQPDPGVQPGAHDLGHQPHRADRPGVSAPLCSTTWS
jgi:hypothetical protein